LARVTPDTFKAEITEALRAYERYVVCIDKTPDECRESIISLLHRAIEVYRDRKPDQRHGIALDRHITVILSQAETERPLCGIYFNLHSPHAVNLRSAGAGGARKKKQADANAESSG
jgi:hypothetical protein